MTVFIVTSQTDYEDHQVCGVFSSEEKAKEYIGNAPENFGYAIETWQVDALKPQLFVEWWDVWLCMDGSPYSLGSKSKDSKWCEVSGLGYEVAAGGTSHMNPDMVPDVSRGWARWPKMHAFYGESCLSYEHAVELAQGLLEKTKQEHPDWFSLSDTAAEKVM